MVITDLSNGTVITKLYAGCSEHTNPDDYY